jgi:hypothetical protein
MFVICNILLIDEMEFQLLYFIIELLIISQINLTEYMQQQGNIENSHPPISPTKRGKNKIEHQIDNEGCKCDLCQKIAIKEMKVIKTIHIEDRESELTKGKR